MKTYEENLDIVIGNIREMLLKKNHDYGSENLKKFGQYGIMVRLTDKISRLDNLLSGDRAMVKSETIDDTFMDIAGYAIQSLVLFDSESK